MIPETTVDCHRGRCQWRSICFGASDTARLRRPLDVEGRNRFALVHLPFHFRFFSLQNAMKSPSSPADDDHVSGTPKDRGTHIPEFAEFLQTMKQPKASDLVRAIRTFIRTFESQQPAKSRSASVNTTTVQEKNGSLVSGFLDQMEALLARHVLFGGTPDTSEEERRRKVEDGIEGLEKYIMSKLYGMTFQVVADEVDKDDRCQRLCRALSFLDVNTVIGTHSQRPGSEGDGNDCDTDDANGANRTDDGTKCDADHDKLDDFCVAILDEHIDKAAQEHLLAMDKYKAPRDKLVCLMNVQSLLEEGIRRVNASDTTLSFAGADAFFPMLVLVVIRARPAALCSNIEYIRRFRGPMRLGGKCDFMLSCLESVALYLDTVDWRDLRIERDEWMCRLCDEGIPEAMAQIGGRVEEGSGDVGDVDAVSREGVAVGDDEKMVDQLDKIDVPGNNEESEADGDSAVVSEHLRDVEVHPASTTGNTFLATLVASLIEEGTPLVLHEESEGLLQQKYPFIYADAGDVRDAQNVDQLLSAYRDLVVKHEALKLAIEKGEGSAALQRLIGRAASGRTATPSSVATASATAPRMPSVTDLVQKMSMYSGWGAKGEGNTDSGTRAVPAGPGFGLSSLFGGARSTAPGLSPVTASVARRVTPVDDSGNGEKEEVTTPALL